MQTWIFLVGAAALAAAASNGSTPALRIMPLGASVTFGVGSTTGDSYRKALRDTLVAAGHSVDMVGSKRNGNDFEDNDVEATSGFVISQIAASAHTAAAKFKPNVVLVDAGTNNCNKGGMVPDAGKNVSALVEDLYQQSPGTTVVLTTVLANKNTDQDACRVDVNKQYAELASNFTAAGAKFVMVDMRGADGPTTADLNDTRHPNDRGYQKMAVVWNQGIQEALAKGFITEPGTNGSDATSTSSAVSTSTAISTASTAVAAITTGVASSTSVEGASSTPTAASTLAGDQGDVQMPEGLDSNLTRSNRSSQSYQSSRNTSTSMVLQGDAGSVHFGAEISVCSVVLASLIGFWALL